MKTNVYTKGAIEKGAIVFIHGNSLSGDSFRTVFDLIDDIPLVAIDLPGHGLSAPATNPAQTYCLPGYVEAIKQLVEEFKLDNYILAGHSLGGHIAMEAAGELKGLRGLFLFGAPPLGIPPDMAKAFLPNPVMPLLFQQNLSDAEVKLLCDAYIQNISANVHLLPLITEQIKKTDGNARLHLLHSIGAGKHLDEAAIVKNLQIPLAFAHGEKDPVVNLSYIQSLDSPTLWEGRVHVINNSGHSPQMEQPGAFADLIRRFYRYAQNG